MRRAHTAAKGLLLFKGDEKTWQALCDGGRSRPTVDELNNAWTVRPVNMGTARHRCIARAQARSMHLLQKAHFSSLGQHAVGTRRGCELLAHVHNLHMHLHPNHITTSLDSYNAYNEMEPTAMAEGILTAPSSHHSIYSYFRLTSGEPPRSTWQGWMGLPTGSRRAPSKAAHKDRPTFATVQRLCYAQWPWSSPRTRWSTAR